MLPGIAQLLNEELEQETDYEIAPSLTYRLREDGRILGKADGLDAVRQAVDKIFKTERYENLADGWDYGIELRDLIGEPTEYVIPELQYRIEDALGQDDRIESVDSFTFEERERSIGVSFTVHSIFGDFSYEEEVGPDV